MINRPRTLWFRLTFWYIAAFLGLFITTLVTLSFTMNENLDAGINDELIEEVGEFTVFFESGGLERLVSEIEDEALEGEDHDEFIRLIDQNGDEIFSSQSIIWNDLNADLESVSQNLDSNKIVFRDFEYKKTSSDGEEYTEYFREVYSFFTPEVGIHHGRSLEQKEDLMETLNILFFTMLIVIIPVTSLVGWFIARNAVKGIDEVSRTAAAIHSGQLDHRVQVKSQDQEIQNLATTFNAMLDRIKILVSEMRSMIENIAHDLRSPLTRIRLISESIASNNQSSEEITNSASQTIEECDRLLHMVNVSLDVAEAEAGTEIENYQEVDLSEIARDACDLFGPVAQQSNITLDFHIQDNCRINGSVQSLQRMLSNVLDNALKYSESGGNIILSAKFNSLKATITVTDTGIGIPETDLERIFDRFYRCDQSRTMEGCGLGLSYARAVARSHGGNITVDSEIDIGSTFSVTLPVL